MESNLVIIAIRSIYGNVKAWPINHNAKLFAEIAGTKTLTIATLARISALGFQIELVNPDSLTLASLTN